MPSCTPLAERFLNQIDIPEDSLNDCWVWAGSRHRFGYGMIGAGGRGGRTLTAHRVSYALFIGDIPDGLQIDHLCRNPPCANPWHLEPVTQIENIRRGDAVRKWQECKRGHRLDDGNVYYKTNPSGTVGRQCKACAKNRAAKRRAQSCATS